MDRQIARTAAQGAEDKFGKEANQVRQVLGIIVIALAGMGLSLKPSAAQSSFSPAIKVGEGVITWFQLDQRTAFMTLLNAAEDLSLIHI